MDLLEVNLVVGVVSPHEFHLLLSFSFMHAPLQDLDFLLEQKQFPRLQETPIVAVGLAQVLTGHRSVHVVRKASVETHVLFISGPSLASACGSFLLLLLETRDLLLHVEDYLVFAFDLALELLYGLLIFALLFLFCVRTDWLGFVVSSCANGRTYNAS